MGKESSVLFSVEILKLVNHKAMKTRVLILISLLIAGIGIKAGDETKKSGTGDDRQLTVYSSEDLESLTAGLANAFNQANPDFSVKVEVSENVISNVSSGDHIGIAAGPDFGNEENRADWIMTVGRDIIVPVINSTNPWLKEISSTGITPGALSSLINSSQGLTWGQIIPGAGESAIHIYLSDERAVQDAVLKFSGVDRFPAGSDRIVITGSKEVARIIPGDPLAIGFCRLSDVLGQGSNGLIENLNFLPVDKNANGKLDYIENIYGDAETFTRGVWIGKYPKTLYNEIYAFSSGQPENAAAVAFLNWIVTAGQKQLQIAGFSELVLAEQQAKLDRINNVPVYTAPVEQVYSIPKVILLIAAGVLMLGLIVSTMMRNRRIQPVAANPVLKPVGGIFDENSVEVPRGLYYDRTHTWAFMEKDGSVRVGIDDFLQHVTGTITRLEMKKPGEKINKGELLVSLIQRGKTLKIYSPVSGTILESNKSLQSNSTLLNSSPYANGWVYTVEPSNWPAEQRFLQVADKYVRWIYGEFSRLKDFLAISLDADKLKYSRVVLQDGGALRDNILEEFGPEVWEDFQTDFLDAE